MTIINTDTASITVTDNIFAPTGTVRWVDNSSADYYPNSLDSYRYPIVSGDPPYPRDHYYPGEYVECPYCGTKQKRSDVLKCRACGGPLDG